MYIPMRMRKRERVCFRKFVSLKPYPNLRYMQMRDIYINTFTTAVTKLYTACRH